MGETQGNKFPVKIWLRPFDSVRLTKKEGLILTLIFNSLINFLKSSILITKIGMKLTFLDHSFEKETKPFDSDFNIW